MQLLVRFRGLLCATYGKTHLSTLPLCFIRSSNRGLSFILPTITASIWHFGKIRAKSRKPEIDKMLVRRLADSLTCGCLTDLVVNVGCLHFHVTGPQNELRYHTQ